MNQVKLLNYFEYKESEDVAISLPNEIFDDFNGCTAFLSFRQKAFAYCYYYLVSYLYRNCVYGRTEELEKFGQIKLIEVLGVSRKHYNHITKKNGVLDSLGYTVNERDFPIDRIINNGELEGFLMFYKDLEKEIIQVATIPSKFAIKKPLKAFYRDKEDTVYSGTFFSPIEIHLIDFSIFAKCLEFPQGLEMFYIFGFLKAREFIFKNKTIYRQYIAKCLDIHSDSLREYLKALEGAKILKISESKNFQYNLRKKVSISS